MNKEGDLWNGEDLSIYSEEQKCGLKEEDGGLFIYNGLHAARVFVWPYARCVAETPLVNTFDVQKGMFLSNWRISGSEIEYELHITR